MTWLASKRPVLGLGLICCGGWLLAAGCGSSDGKKRVPSSDAGAAGESESAAGQSGAGGAPTDSPGGVGGESVAGAPGGAGGAASFGGAGGDGGAGGGPAPTCVAEGSITGLSLNPEPIYQGCRGALVKVPFDVDVAADTFTCCGASTSSPAFTLSLDGTYNQDGGGDLVFEVPDDAPFGSYALNLVCQTQPNDQVIAIEINDLAAPTVTGLLSTEVLPTRTVSVTGENLEAVTYVNAVHADGTGFECVIQEQTHTATQLDCSFPNGVPISSYFLELYTERCGYAVSPTFMVIAD
jgi:hypothetical protein